MMLLSVVVTFPAMAADACDHADATIVNRVYLTGGIVLSDYECACGATWTADADGTTYTSVTTGCATCRSETVWTATDGSGKTYSLEKIAEEWIDDAAAKATGKTKNVTGAGLCSSCFTSVWMPSWGTQVNTSTSADFSATTGESVKPVWDVTTQGIKAARGGKFSCITGMGTDVSTPFIFSFDLNVSDIIAGTGTSKSHYPLVWWGVVSGSSASLALLRMGATGTDASSVYLTLGSDYSFANGEKDAICYLTRGEWYKIEIAVDPTCGSYWVFVNGEFVGMDNGGATFTAAQKTGITKTIIQFGQGGNTVPYYYGYGVKNMDIDVTDATGIYTKLAAKELIKIGYDYSSLTAADFDVNGGISNLLGTRNAIFASDRTIVKSGNESYGFYNISTSTSTSGKAYDFSMSTVSGSTVSNATVVSPFSDGKYEIKMDFAIASDNYYNGGNVNANVIRLMKYGDNIKSCLVTYNPNNGYAYMANGKPLYAADGETFLTPRRAFVDGVPQATETLGATSELRVIVDEDAGLYSIYVDGNPAYFYNENKQITAFIDQPMPAEWADYLIEKGWEQGNQTFGDITYDLVKGYGAAGSGREYIRILQGIRKFAIKELTVTLIPDEAIELVGVQENVDETSFDVRFVVGVDDIYSSKLNFKVDAFYNGVYQGTQHVDTDVAYAAVNAGSGKLYAYDCPEGNYLAAFKIVGMERTGVTNSYQFIVTPYYEGQNPAEQISYTVIYNGEGACMSNGKQWSSDMEEYHAPASPVLLEMTKSSADAYNNFNVYVRTSDPSGKYYVRYKFLYAYNTATANGADSGTNVSLFRIDGATLVEVAGVSKTKIASKEIADVLTNGEITLAMLEEYGDGTTAVDFIGGYHGDEHLTSFVLTADGVAYTPGAEAKIVSCDTLGITQVSELERWANPAGDADVVAKHTQVYTIDENGFKVDRSIEWLVDDFTINNAYAIMFTMRRLSFDKAVCETVSICDAAGNVLGSQTISASTDVSSQYSILNNDDTRQVKYTDATSGISATVGFEIGSGAAVKEGKNYIAVRKNSVGDNKWYVSFNSAENGQTP
ncbi:MAG: hypothetical protein IKV00_07410, partial [Clostridia bacterium]|nr:hypothetical protein [Clostridia bacterium]